ncbi:MAG: hypothetical protein ACREBB_07240 [Nitrosotalea sp.]
MESDDFREIVEACGKMLDESIDILSDLEFEIDSEKEDVVIPDMTKSDLVDMAHDVSDSVRIKKAESLFIRRHLDNSDNQL